MNPKKRIGLTFAVGVLTGVVAFAQARAEAKVAE